MSNKTSPRILKQPSRERNDSISSFESIINELSPEESKFCSTFIENWELFQAHVNSFQVMHTHHLFGSKFVIYKLKVVTDHVCYYIEKRYRDFLSLYNKVSQFFTPKTVFPSKTHFRSKVCPFLTENRRRIFDGLLSEIISMRNSNKSVVSELIIFLDIKDHYNQLGLNQSIFLADKITDEIKEKNYLFGHFLRHQLLKISLLPNKSLHYLQRLENLLCFVNRSIVRLDDLRALMIGANKVPGLIQVALSSVNEVTSLTFIRSVKKLIDLQVCPYAQAFRRIIETAPAHLFYLSHEEVLQNQQFLVSYFELVDLYLKLRLNSEGTGRTDTIIKEILNDEAIKKYVEWKMGRRSREDQIRRKTKFQMNLCKSIEEFRSNLVQSKTSEASSIQQQVEIEDCQDQFYRQIKELSKSQRETQQKQLFKEESSYCEANAGKGCLYFSIVCKKNFSQISQIAQRWTHNKLVTSYYPAQQLTHINRVFFTFEGKSEKLFQFQEKVSYSQPQIGEANQLQIIMTPSSGLKTKNNFFYWLKASPLDEETYLIRILYYFHNRKVKNLFSQELSGKRNAIWTSICGSFLQKKPSSSFGSIKTEETLPGV